jgi:hypothetical protein
MAFSSASVAVTNMKWLRGTEVGAITKAMLAMSIVTVVLKRLKAWSK